jgi:colicin import membrane protein
MIGLAVVLALAAALAAVAFFLQSRSARLVAQQRATELDELKRAAEGNRAENQALRAENKERRDEVGNLRADLAASKKKAFEQAEAAKKAGGAAALRAEIDKLTTRLAEARAEAAQQSDRVRAAEAAIERQARELEKLRASEQRKPEPAPAAPAAESPAAAAPEIDPAQLQAERERADRAESKLADARKRAAEVERDLKNARGRLETEKRVYMVQKGELELAQDRYVELRRRHESLRREHDELLDALRQAAREDGRRASEEKSEDPAKPVEGSAA